MSTWLLAGWRWLALVPVLMLGLAGCAKRPVVALPEAPLAAATPAPEVEQGRAAALVRDALSVEDARRRVRLPDASGIRLARLDDRPAYAFSCRYDAYVPGSSLPWVYQASGTVDLPARRVVLRSLTLVEDPALGALARAARVAPRLSPRATTEAVRHARGS